MVIQQLWDTREVLSASVVDLRKENEELILVVAKGRGYLKSANHNLRARIAKKEQEGND